MTRSRKYIVAILLTVMMGIPAFAGETPTPSGTTPPPPAVANAGETPMPSMSATNDILTEMLFNLASLMLPLI